jgi:RES domain-containing protein
MLAFRIADQRFRVFDGTGPKLVGGRWNSPGRPVIYAAQTFAGAVLEVLVHSNLGRVPKTHAVIEITVPDGLHIEAVSASALRDWDAEDQMVSRSYGDQWLEERRTAVLLAPSVVTRGREHNVVFNPEHSDFAKITASRPQQVDWDERLFQRLK